MFWKNEKNNDIKNYFVERYRVAHPAERDAPQVPDVLSNHAHVDDVIVKSDHAHVDDVIAKPDHAHVDDVIAKPDHAHIDDVIAKSDHAHVDDVIVKSDHAHVDDVIVKSDRAHVDDVTTRRSLIRRLIFPSQQADADSLKLVQWITVILSKFLFWTCPMSVYTRLHVSLYKATCQFTQGTCLLIGYMSV